VNRSIWFVYHRLGAMPTARPAVVAAVHGSGIFELRR